MVKLGYVIHYVVDVGAALAFFEKGFSLARRFLHESGAYGELDTGETCLAFASRELGKSNFGRPITPPADLPSCEIALVVENVGKAIAGAVKAGAEVVAEPVVKPWGQTVGWVRSPDGILIEVCTAI